jgi:hypothetical protein
VSASYGHCPHCGAEVVTRERGLNGNDTCAAGHVYPSAFTLSKLAADWCDLVRSTLILVGEQLRQYAAGTIGMSERQIRELANRCRRTLHAIPLVRKEPK